MNIWSENLIISNFHKHINQIHTVPYLFKTIIKYIAYFKHVILITEL